MSFYWLYDLPNWMFAAVVVATFVAVGVFGVILTRKWVRKLHKIDHSHNDIVGYFLAAVTVFYGITLGLVAVGTWESYASVQNQVDLEAQIVGSIYRDVGSYDEPLREKLRADMKAYVRDVIDVGWPLQRQGITPYSSGLLLERFQSDLMASHPTTMSQEILQMEVFKQFNSLVEARRARLNSTTSGLPGSIWALVIIGGFITIAVTTFFDTNSLAIHLWMTGLSAALLGLLIFLIGTLDHPFRGRVSVRPDAFTLVYSQLMAGAQK